MVQSARPRPVADLRPTLAYFAIAATLIVLGLILRFVPLGINFRITKYGGSALWAAMVYFLFAALLPHFKPWAVALIAILFSNLLELSRLYHRPSLDAFRLTLAGAILLGRVFEPGHLVAYTVSILVVATFDTWAVRPRLLSHE